MPGGGADLESMNQRKLWERTQPYLERPKEVEVDDLPTGARGFVVRTGALVILVLVVYAALAGGTAFLQWLDG